MNFYVLRGEVIARLAAPRGNNLHEVEAPKEDSDGQLESFLVSMPTKFRKNVWVKRGDFVVVEPIEEGGKVKAEIVRVLYKDQIKYLKQQGVWPKQFSKSEEEEETPNVADLKISEDKKEEEEDASSNSDSDDDLFQNTNRRVIEISEDEETSSEEENEEQ